MHPSRERDLRWIIATPLGIAALVFALSESTALEVETQSESIEQHIERLIERLGDKDYFVRQRAQAALAEFSFDAFDALRAATTHEDLEISARAKYLLRVMQVAWTGENDPPEVQRLLRDYGYQDIRIKLDRIESLAGLPDHKGAAALCRLVRYEKSLVLSKLVATRLLETKPHGEPPGRELTETLRNNLTGSHRKAARWLLSWPQFGDAPEAALAEWTKLTEAEYASLRRSPGESSPQVVASLVRFQIAWLKRLDRSDRVVAAICRLIDLEKGDPSVVVELRDWLIEQKALKLDEEVAKRFAANPVMLYTVAQAQTEQNEPQHAEATVRQALKLNPGKDERSLLRHYIAARDLGDRGRFRWARGEYQQVIDTGSPGSRVVAYAYSGLGEMLHDQQEDVEAAALFQNLATALEKHADRATLANINPAESRARANYFLACHWQRENDRDKQRECLGKALDTDASEIDTLIACFRLPDQPPEYRQRIRSLIAKSVRNIRREIAAEPDNPTAYNQFAWLVGNTEGDFDEAIGFSKKSIQLSPGYGGYYDTLAHAYFAKGDYENAVNAQVKAAELEPHSGLIARQLAVFRARWEEEKKEKRHEDTSRQRN